MKKFSVPAEPLLIECYTVFYCAYTHMTLRISEAGKSTFSHSSAPKGNVSFCRHIYNLLLSLFGSQATPTFVGDQPKNTSQHSLDSTLCEYLARSSTDATIASFTSPSARRAVNEFVSAPSVLVREKHYTPLQQIRMAMATQPNGKIALGGGFFVSNISEMPESAMSSPSDPQKIVVTISSDRGVEKDVTLIDFAPPFDGVKLLAEDILKCYDGLNELKANVNECGSGPLFTSAKGVGRSAALLIADRFDNSIKSQPNLTNLNVEPLVKELISQARQQSTKYFIHTTDQEREVIRACQTLLDRELGSRKSRLIKESNPEKSIEAFSIELPESAPLTTIDDLDKGKAYRPSAPFMHCARKAINAFFQGDVLNAVQTANLLLDAEITLATGEVYGGNEADLKGLFIPTIVDKIRKGQVCRISKSEFLGESNNENGLDTLMGRDLSDEWDRLLTVCLFPKNKLDNRKEFESAQHIEFDAAQWVSANRGLDFSHLKKAINSILATKADKPQWHHLPNRVSEFEIGSADSQFFVHALKEKVSTHGVSAVSPMIVLSGDGLGGGSNHYYTVARNNYGQWLKLDRPVNEASAVDQCQIWANSDDDLCQALKENRITHVLTPLSE